MLLLIFVMVFDFPSPNAIFRTSCRLVHASTQNLRFCLDKASIFVYGGLHSRFQFNMFYVQIIRSCALCNVKFYLLFGVTL